MNANQLLAISQVLRELAFLVQEYAPGEDVKNQVGRVNQLADDLEARADATPPEGFTPTADEDLIMFLQAACRGIDDFLPKDRPLSMDELKLRNIQRLGERLGNDHRGMFLPYTVMVQNLFKPMNSPAEYLMHAGVGCAGEAGELADWIKKHWVYEIPLDAVMKKENNQTLQECILEELGDSYFYMQAILLKFGWTWADVRMANSIKLGKRYPHGVYTNEHAKARLDKETSD